MKTKPIIFLLIAVIILVTSCEDSTFLNGEVTERTVYLYLDYWNPEDSKPQIEFDSDLSSEAVIIDFNKPYGAEEISTTRAHITFSDIRIVDEYGNFRILDITPEEYKENLWKPQSEFEVTYSNEVSNVDVVLVLDASGSLGDDFTDIKKYAADFVNDVNNSMDGAQFGVVYFNDTVDYLSLTDDINVVESYINNRANDGYTALYEAMLTGLSILDSSTAESKVMLTFTDGNDSQDGAVKADVIEKLNYVPDDSIRVQSYTIGFEGEDILDKTTLNDLSVRGVSVFPEDKEEVEEFFEYFSNVIATVYTLTYERNNSTITEDDKREIRFKIHTTQK